MHQELSLQQSIALRSGRKWLKEKWLIVSEARFLFCANVRVLGENFDGDYLISLKDGLPQNIPIKNVPAKIFVGILLSMCTKYF